jgi:hypothetical protein
MSLKAAIERRNYNFKINYLIENKKQHDLIKNKQ